MRTTVKGWARKYGGIEPLQHFGKYGVLRHYQGLVSGMAAS
jgi:hypothetical protein